MTDVNTTATTAFAATANNAVISPTISNTEGLDIADYDVSSKLSNTPSVEQQVQFRESLQGKSYEEQIDIINKNTNDKNTSPEIDITDVENIEQEQPKVDEKNIENMISNIEKELGIENTVDEPNNEGADLVDSILNSIEKDSTVDTKEETADPEKEEESSDDITELSQEEREAMKNSLEEKQKLESEFNEVKKNLYSKEAEIDILTDTVEKLKAHIKDNKGKLDFYESTANVLDGDDEKNLINLRRSAVSDESGKSSLKYLNYLSSEREAITGNSLDSVISQLYEESKQKVNVEADEYLSSIGENNKQNTLVNKDNNEIIDDYLI